MTPKELRKQFEKETGGIIGFSDITRYARWLEQRLLLSSEGLDEETREQIEHILSIDSKDIVFAHAQQYLQILYNKLK